MFGYFRKQSGKDQYVLRVAAILREYIGPAFHAYNLAEECLGDLRDSIANGMFHDGPNPQENVMAYYSICSMISETSSADDKTTVLKLSVMAGILKDQLGAFENMTPLEKGIWQFGEQVLAGGLMAPSADTIAKIKSATVQIIMDLMKDQEVAALEQDVKTIVDNVSSNTGDREVSKLGERVLAISVLSNATGFYIDQGENDLAYSYFMCVSPAIQKYFEREMESYSDYQKSALRVIVKNHRSLAQELITD